MRLWKKVVKGNATSQLMAEHKWRTTDKVLLIGAVDVNNLEWLLRKVSRVAVMDFDSKRLEILHNNMDKEWPDHEVLFVKSPMIRTPWFEATFNHVWLVPTQGLGSKPELWKEMHRILRPKGRVTITQYLDELAASDHTADLFAGGFENLQTQAIPSWDSPKYIVYRANRENS